jgi:anti-anti-sigma factor
MVDMTASPVRLQSRYCKTNVTRNLRTSCYYFLSKGLLTWRQKARFVYEVEKCPTDEHGNKVTTIRFHGRLVAETAAQARELVKPLIPEGGRIVSDLGDVTYLDRSGLGALLSLKVSAIRQGFCRLELANLTPRIMELHPCPESNP